MTETHDVTILESGVSQSERAHEDVPSSMIVSHSSHVSHPHLPDDLAELRQHFVDDMVGNDAIITSPLEINPGEYAKLPLVYCDFTASHRPVKSIENYISETCLPLYGNTHTNTSITGSQSTAFCAESRQVIGEACGAKTTGKASTDVVLFAGNGTTCAVQLLIDCLGLRHAPVVDVNKPVIFVGPFEHHSNLLPWRELGNVIVEMISTGEDGNVDLHNLEVTLQKYQKHSVKIGSFSATSNVSGIVADHLAITALLHKYGALSVWDFATAASYMNVEMNPIHPDYEPEAIAKDAVVWSGHKVAGGVGSPGVLIIKKRLVSQKNPPERSGGGTVFYVTSDHHRFLSNRIERYEGGTPNVVGIWRLGLATIMKQQFKQQAKKYLQADQNSLTDYDFQRARDLEARMMKIPNLVLLDGDYSASQAASQPKKLPVFSFLIKCGTRFLHYNYVCALLNDLFGIQTRGGCQCAGPYAQHLLGLDSATNAAVELYLVETKHEVLRPGFSRLSLPTMGTTAAMEDYVVDALAWVARNGWKMMHVYRCNYRTAMKNQPHPSDSSELPTFEQAMETANKLLDLAINDQSSLTQAVKTTQDDQDSSISSALRWFAIFREVAPFCRDGLDQVPQSMDRELVEGAVRPIAWFPKQFIHDPKETTVDITEIETKPVTASQLHFREGDHTGIAPLNEIQSGYDDGELSDACCIFMPEADEWEPIATALEKLASSGNVPVVSSSNPVHKVSSSPPPIQASSQAETKIDDPVVVQEVSKSPSTAVDTSTKKDEKKPQRDASAWGQGAMVSMDHISAEPAPAKKSRHKHIKPPAKIMRLVTQAMMQWDMLEEGDRLLLGLSGGKDSLSLLHILLEFRKKLPINFEIEVCTIDPMTPSFDPSPLIGYVESLGLKYHYVRDAIVDRATGAGKDGAIVSSLCAYCARMKRGNLYSCARENNCNKLVLAQHLDDLAESFMMSVMHNGFLRTMKANYKINAGDISVIRPLAYCREALMADFAKSAKLPIINENCPACFEEPKERARVKKLLSREEALYPNFYDNIKRSIMPLMHDDSTAILRSYTEEALAKSRRDKGGKKATPSSTSKKIQETTTEEIGNAALLSSASEEELVRELARRRADRYRLAGSMKRVDEDDPTGQWAERLETLGASWETFKRENNEIVDDLVQVGGIPILAARDVVKSAKEFLAQQALPTAIFWDLESMPIPSTVSGTAVATNLKQIVCGLGHVSLFHAYGPELSEHQLVEAETAGCQMMEKEIATNKVAFVVDSMEFAQSNPNSRVCLVTGNQDHLYLLSTIQRHCKVTTLVGTSMLKPAFGLSDSTWISWEDDILPKEGTRIPPGIIMSRANYETSDDNIRSIERKHQIVWSELVQNKRNCAVLRMSEANMQEREGNGITLPTEELRSIIKGIGRGPEYVVNRAIAVQVIRGLKPTNFPSDVQLNRFLDSAISDRILFESGDSLGLLEKAQQVVNMQLPQLSDCKLVDWRNHSKKQKAATTSKSLCTRCRRTIPEEDVLYGWASDGATLEVNCSDCYQWSKEEKSRAVARVVVFFNFLEEYEDMFLPKSMASKQIWLRYSDECLTRKHATLWLAEAIDTNQVLQVKRGKNKVVCLPRNAQYCLEPALSLDTTNEENFIVDLLWKKQETASKKEVIERLKLAFPHLTTPLHRGEVLRRGHESGKFHVARAAFDQAVGLTEEEALAYLGQKEENPYQRV
eukprot:Nitzschia sp. Nitz4//scaffold107_size73032//38978//44923//NITZ4_005762-RA/size73032-processed-gene-0.110-mRNA-1//1//CDS//3329532599//2818//frame0